MAFIAFIVMFLVATFPATWLLMLFLGNTGVLVSYWGTLPLGILVSALLGGVSAPIWSTYSSPTLDRPRGSRHTDAVCTSCAGGSGWAGSRSAAAGS